MRRGVLSSPPVACTTYAKFVKQIHECAKILQSGCHIGFCKESVAITLSTNCDLAIECLGVRAIESLDSRVATIVLRMMKRKVATSRFSNFDSRSARNASSSGLCRTLSSFGIKEFCRPFLVEDL